MTSPLLLVLSSAPLACYFWVLAMWHGGRHPRAVSGSADFALLAAGVGSLLTFGPFGQILARRFLGEPGLGGWIALASGAAAIAAACGRRSRNRIVIYNIDPEALDRVLQEVLDLRSGRYRRTISGFEDPGGKVGLSVEASRRFHYAVLEARGAHPAAFLGTLRRTLGERFQAIATSPSPIAWWLLALSTLTMLASLAGYLAMHPRGREALRLLIDRIGGR